MTAAVVAASVALVLFAAAAPRLAEALPPAVTVRVLGPATVVSAGCAAFVLSVVTFAWLGQLTQVAARGSWSPDTLRDLDPLPRQVSIAAGFMIVPLAAWTTWTVMVRGRALWVTHRACRHLQPTTHGSYSIVDSAALDAFTTASGHIIFTTGLLEVLTPAQQQIVLTHERSHHRHRHNWWTLAVDLAAAVNPLLRPTAAGIRHATERWADEDAATVADRHTVAVTIANVALLRSRAAAVAPAAMGATGGQVPRRVQALLGPAPRTRPRPLLMTVALTGTVLAATIAVQRATETLFELAMH